ncbi:MAG: radical SAM protein, partial [candidate division Zixibacteria bacterium]|nr:radical SAM protein [candidate division Zixibacteria bacterium]
MENFRKINKYENPRVLDLQRGCIYGPVNSRRLGSSLGLNLLPRDYKLCSFNCIYCQYGLNPPQNAELIEEKRDDLPSVSKIRKTLLAALSSVKQRIAYITFSGNGEPTLHPDFPEIVEVVREIRDRYVSRAKLAILSNSTTINNPGIAEALSKLDSPIMKLDAGSEKLFKKINRPAKGFDFNEIVEGLIKFDHPNLIIQALLIGGTDLNASEENIERWASLLKKIKPSQVQIYSLDRPPARLD